ncbi:HlyD family secretion protein [Kushneria phosphatilytica]|uniref:HlyD family efflux transporter periplasmic adaptor subunit n=1 Tax=Kushneria phosphatilytica TaxID=657387 RepID=A0A1S1NYC5_9GAMM|nr:HlyD family efflux transporter periplasmic adaptor subunit [Kushneria phosphatilytica]OHV10034.1 glycoside hydrolase family 43 [Kushneria phosphatilytica]QEL11721.1 HlyD family efflux transporter periplasmic adaptor subunit [Kushneria phosphatilytica]
MRHFSARPLLRWFGLATILILSGGVLWWWLQPAEPDDVFARGNGRVEATEIDVATRLGGRVEAIAVAEGALVEPGQLLARMDTRPLEAQLDQARAQKRQAENALETARSLLAQRKSEKTTAQAVVEQRRAELVAAHKRYQRTRELVARNALSRQQLDDDQASWQSAQAALTAARTEVLSAEAAIRAADSQVIEAGSSIEAAQAAVRQLQVDLDDCQLHADRVARVQYRIAEPGEVLAPGGRVLNLVDLTDVYMTFFLPATQAGRVALGEEVRLVLDAAPQYVIPARVSYVASVAQFTPRTVETRDEREKLMFRVKARIDPQLLREHIEQVKTGLPGMAWLKLDDSVEWPPELRINVSS